MAYFRTFLCLGLLLVPALALADDAVGRFANVVGSVKVDGKEAAIGDPIHVGSVIETSGGRASLLIGKETIVHVGDDSKMEITQHLIDSAGAESSLLDLKYGATRALVRSASEHKKSFHIRARAATMGVRGTQIYIDNPKDLSTPPRFLTIEGLAEVSMPGGQGGNSAPVLLKAHQSIQVAENAGATLAPKVETLSADRVRDLADRVAPPPEEANTQNDFEKKKHHHEHHGKGEGEEGLQQPPPPLSTAPAPLPKTDPVVNSSSKAAITIGVTKK